MRTIIPFFIGMIGFIILLLYIPDVALGFLLGIIFYGIVIWFYYYLSYNNFMTDSFFSGDFLQQITGKNGLTKFRKKILNRIKELKDYQVFFFYDNQVESYTQNTVVLEKEERKILEAIIQKSFHKAYHVVLEKPLSFMHPDFKCYAYSYNISFFNKRVLILTYVSPFTILNSVLQEQIKSVNDIVSVIAFLSELSRGNRGIIDLLKEMVQESPFALGICNPAGEIVFGNEVLYRMFQGDIPNFTDLIGHEIFMLLLEGKRVGQYLNIQGRRIQLEAYPLSNKNFLITRCFFILYDEHVEYQQDILGEPNTLRRFTSGNAIIGAAMFTLDGIILYSNEAFMRSLDVFKVREAKQKDIFELFYLTSEYYEKLVETILKGEEHRTALTARENEQEFQVLFKGLVFGNKTIVEVVLEGDSIYQQNMSYLDKETQAIYEELQTARSVQEHILSLPTIYRPGVGVDTLYIPSRQLSGDFFTIIPFENDQMGFLIADVSGHGVSASLITAALKILIEFAPRDSSSLPKIISYFNTYLADILPEGSFVTLFYGIIDFKDYTLRYINCGHPFPILEDVSMGETKILEGMGYPLGGLLNVSFDDLVYTVSLPHRCKIFLYTDGILQHLQGSMKEKLSKISSLIDTQKAIGDKELLQKIYTHLISRNSVIAEDDVSMMLVSLDKTQTKKHHLYISSTILEVDTVIAEIGGYIQKEAQIIPSIYWKLHTCFHEALLNAIVHGNKYNTQKKVYVEFRIVKNLIVIRIRDEGLGFNYNNIQNPFDPENILKDFGRGITMIKTLADKVKFNAKGNEITMFFITEQDT